MSCPGKVPQSTWRQNEIRIESSARSHLKTGEVMGVIGLEESLVSLTITIYLLMSVVYTSAPKARYRYRLEITSSSSARYFTRWFESRWCTDVEGLRYYVRLRADNSDRRLPTCLATRDRTEQKCNDQDLVNGLLIARPVVLHSLR